MSEPNTSAASATNTTRSRLEHGQAKWDQMRPTIEELYYRTGPAYLTWKMIMDALAEQGFHTKLATLKEHCKKWNFTPRNLTESSVCAVLQSNNSLVIRTMRGRQVDTADAQRYYQRLGMTSPQIETLAAQSSPEDQAIDTPPSESSPSSVGVISHATARTPESGAGASLTAPNDLAVTPASAFGRFEAGGISMVPTYTWLDKASDNLLRCVRNYYDDRLDKWTLAVKGAEIDHMCSSIDYGGLSLRYDNARERGSRDDFRATLATLFEQAEPLLLHQDPRLLLYVLETIGFALTRGYITLAQRINAHFMCEANRLLGTGHAITIFCAAILHAAPNTQGWLVELALNSMLDRYEQKLNPPESHGPLDMSLRSYETSRILPTAATILKHFNRPRTAVHFYRKLRDLCVFHHGLSSPATVQCLVDEAHVRLDLNDDTGAQRVLDTAVLSEIGIHGDCAGKAESTMRCLVAQSVVYGKQNQPMDQLQLLTQALEVSNTYKLEADHWAVRDVLARRQTLYNNGMSFDPEYVLEHWAALDMPVEVGSEPT